MGRYTTQESATVKVIAINRGSKRRGIPPTIEIESTLSTGESRNLILGEGDVLHLTFNLEFDEQHSSFFNGFLN